MTAILMSVSAVSAASVSAASVSAGAADVRADVRAEGMLASAGPVGGPAQAQSTQAADESSAERSGPGSIIVEPPMPVRSASHRSRRALSPAYPLDQTFLLHSRPGAPRVIVLDFDGLVLDRTLWNSQFSLANGTVVGGYDTDGDPLTFSSDERLAVQEVWERVSEDYAPFDVDVTTQDPGEEAIRRSSETDTSFGTRVAITSDPDVECTCGGLASMGAFDTFSSVNPRAHDRTQPVWVFPVNLSTAKDMAEVASHEVGHTLGLSHDGTTDAVANAEYYRGQGPWAPLMGVGYYRPLTQWSDGDYADSTNTEDDIAVMLSSGLSLIPDDHADGPVGATVLAGGVEQSGAGLITTRADVDWFEFRVGSAGARVQVDPAEVGANLDVRLRIARRDGAVLRTITPMSTMLGEGTMSGLGAAVDLELPSGSYALGVDGVGQGDLAGDGYSDYGSLGRYSVTVDAVGLVVVTSALPVAMTGRPYAASLVADGVSDPGEAGAELRWSIINGSLPSGLTLREDGRILGEATAAASSTLTIEVTDGVDTARATLTVDVVAPLRARDLNVSRSYIGRAWTRQLSTSGGLAPLTFAVADGTLPRGVSLAADGTLSGTPLRVGSDSATVMVTDARGRTTQADITWQVHRTVLIMIDSLPVAQVGRTYDAQLIAVGGATALRWRITSGHLPPGLRAGSSGWIRGTPSRSGRWRIEVRATDGTESSERALTIRVRS